MPILSKLSPHRILRRKLSRAPFICMLVKPHLPPCRSHLPEADYDCLVVGIAQVKTILEQNDAE